MAALPNIVLQLVPVVVATDPDPFPMVALQLLGLQVAIVVVDDAVTQRKISLTPEIRQAPFISVLSQTFLLGES